MRIEWKWKSTVLFAVSLMAIATLAVCPALAQEEPVAEATAEGVEAEVEALPAEATFTIPTGEEEEPIIEEELDEGFGAGAVEFFRQGGDFMWALLFCSLLFCGAGNLAVR